MSPAPLDTARLKLIPATLELADADLHNRLEFSHQLGARVLDSWPPPLNDENSMRWTVDYLRRRPGAAGWTAWYWIAKKHKPVAVGMGGFKGLPAAGAAEIGYSLLPEFRGKGYASEAVSALLEWSFSRPELDRVVAETSPELAPSIRLLERAGFAAVGPGSEPGSVRFELTRAAWARKRASA